MSTYHMHHFNVADRRQHQQQKVVLVFQTLPNFWMKCKRLDNTPRQWTYKTFLFLQNDEKYSMEWNSGNAYSTDNSDVGWCYDLWATNYADNERQSNTKGGRGVEMAASLVPTPLDKQAFLYFPLHKGAVTDIEKLQFNNTFKFKKITDLLIM